MKTIANLVLFLFLSLTLSAAEMLTLTSTSGGELKGTIDHGQQPNTVNLIRNDGRLYKDIPISTFSPESRKLITQTLKKQDKERNNADITPESRIEISFQRNKAANNNKYGDIDDRVITIEPRVTLESDEREKTYKDIQGQVIIIGKEAVSKDRWVILNRQSFKIGELGPDDKFTWEGDQFECRYDPDYGGFDYEGYVVYLKNKAGKVAMVKGSNSSWEVLLPTLMKANMRQGYNKDFSSVLNLRTTFGLPGTR